MYGARAYAGAHARLPDGQEDKGEKRARYGSATDAARVDAASALINGGKRRAGCASGKEDAAAEFRERPPMAAEGTRRSGFISSFQRHRCHHGLFRLIAATFRRRAPAFAAEAISSLSPFSFTPPSHQLLFLSPLQLITLSITLFSLSLIRFRIPIVYFRQFSPLCISFSPLKFCLLLRCRQALPPLAFRAPPLIFLSPSAALSAFTPDFQPPGASGG
jgi:hypothetical protein